jgi:ABC-type transport system involved in multi-copper enzyme maturation permease subunit
MNNIKPERKNHEVFSIIKSGITGALALIGICIILFVIGFAFRGQYISYLYQNTFAKSSFNELFIATGGIGFVLGLIMRRRFPIIQRGIVLLACAAIPLIAGAWLLYTFASYSEIVRSMKLADCTGTMTIHLTVPRGHYYRFMLAVPSGSTNKFSGRMIFSDGNSAVTNVYIGFDQTELQGNFLHAETNYDVNILFEQPPPPSSSLWLYWHEGYKDRHN